MRLRAGKTGSGKGAGRMVAQAIGTARAVSAHATILVRGDSMYGSRAVVGTCVRHGAQFSLAMSRNAAIERAIAAIPRGRMDTGALAVSWHPQRRGAATTYASRTRAAGLAAGRAARATAVAGQSR